jgi:hypothetical protein
MELRALDSPNLNKHWLCHQCLPTTQIYKITSPDGNSNTAAPIRHLRKDHKIDFKEKEEENSVPGSPTLPVTIPSLFKAAGARATHIAQGLVTKIRVDISDGSWSNGLSKYTLH